MTRRCLLIAALLLPTAACATAYGPPPGSTGFYRFEAHEGERVLPGTLHIQKRNGAVFCVLVLDESGMLPTRSCELHGDALRLTAEGAGDFVRVQARFSERGLRGSWSTRGVAGSFEARR